MCCQKTNITEAKKDTIDVDTVGLDGYLLHEFVVKYVSRTSSELISFPGETKARKLTLVGISPTKQACKIDGKPFIYCSFQFSEKITGNETSFTEVIGKLTWQPIRLT